MALSYTDDFTGGTPGVPDTDIDGRVKGVGTYAKLSGTNFTVANLGNVSNDLDIDSSSFLREEDPENGAAAYSISGVDITDSQVDYYITLNPTSTDGGATYTSIVVGFVIGYKDDDNFMLFRVDGGNNTQCTEFVSGSGSAGNIINEVVSHTWPAAGTATEVHVRCNFTDKTIKAYLDDELVVSATFTGTYQNNSMDVGVMGQFLRTGTETNTGYATDLIFLGDNPEIPPVVPGQADYFVKTAADGGNDGSAGTTWATAKATLASAISLVSATNKVIAIAPGLYNENSIAAPTQDGAADNWNVIIGDTNEEWTDSGVNTHGLGEGWIVNHNMSANPWFSWTGTDPEYWKLKNLVGLLPLYANQPFAMGGSTDELEMIDCYGWGGKRGILINFGGSSTGTENIKLYRCVAVGVDDDALHFFSTLSAFPSNIMATARSCLGWALGADTVSTVPGAGGIGIGGEFANRKVKGAIHNSSGFAYQSTGTWPGTGLGANQGNSQGTVTKSYGAGEHGVYNFSAAVVRSDNYAQSDSTNNAGTTNTNAAINHIIPVPRVHPYSSIRGLVADYSGSLTGEDQYDLYGNLVTDCIGAEQYVDNDHFLAPPGYIHDNNGGRGVFYMSEFNATAAAVGGGAHPKIIGG